MRIVSLLPSATEICCALGLDEQLVGVTHECDYPPEIRGKPQLTRSMLPVALDAAAVDRHVRAQLHAGSSLYALDAELLERLQPDLIITQELCPVCAVSYEIVAAAAKRLRGDPRIVSLEPSSLEDVFGTIAAVAELAGVPERAGPLLDLLRARVAALARRTRGLARPRTLVLEWTDPPMSGGGWTAELVELAGGAPMLADPGASSRVLAWDAIARADPDVVLVAPCGYDLAAARRAIAAIASEPEWAGLRAVRERRAWAVDGNAYLNRPGPRLVETAEIFAHAIHGDAVPPVIPDDRALAQA
ncbi:MAG: cobalamin-binding protein [Candidatus Eremiobacteraeota bacterium]|nr:cobalamin-binding protein [Candidatus Eremiobacteraeota bacterium]